MTHKYESSTEFEVRLDKMIQNQKLKPEYKSLLLEIAELGEKAYANGLILGLGWSIEGASTFGRYTNSGRIEEQIKQCT